MRSNNNNNNNNNNNKMYTTIGTNLRTLWRFAT